MRFTNLERRLIAHYNDWTCHICGTEIPGELTNPNHPLYLNIDHVHPRSLGGTHEPENLLPAHSFCNNSKNNRNYWATQEDARKWLHFRLNHWKSIGEGSYVERLSVTDIRETQVFHFVSDPDFSFEAVRSDKPGLEYRIVIRRDSEGLKSLWSPEKVEEWHRDKTRYFYPSPPSQELNAFDRAFLEWEKQFTERDRLLEAIEERERRMMAGAWT